MIMEGVEFILIKIIVKYMIGIIVCDNNSFLLPLRNNENLLSYWYMILNDICSKIIIIINEDYNKIVYDNLGDKPFTIYNDLGFIKNEDYDLALLTNVENIIDNINFNIIPKIKFGGLLYWNKIYGMCIFKKEIEDIILTNNIQSNLQLFIKENISGFIWNASNPNDYKNYLNFLTIPNRTYVKGTLIIVSLFIGNIDRNKINISLNCLMDLRRFYPDEIIIIVDNNSPNQEWKHLAKTLGMYIIKNTNELYRFEIGGYNLALKYFKANKYICIQHNIQFHSRIHQELDMNNADAYVFSTTRKLNCDNNGLMLINKYLNFLNMRNWNSEPLAIWNSFYCNDLMMEKIINSGLFDLVSNKKEISQAYERLIGTFLYRNLGYVKVIDKNTFHKNFFIQS